MPCDTTPGYGHQQQKLWVRCGRTAAGWRPHGYWLPNSKLGSVAIVYSGIKNFISKNKWFSYIQLKLQVTKNFGPIVRNALKLSILSGTLFWQYLNSSFISGHVRPLLCMRYHTAWFASIVDCNVKKAIVALWRATLCSSFGDWWGCMETCLTQDTRRSPASRIGPDNWQTLQVLSEYIHFEAYCSLFALGVLGVKLSHILHYSHCRWESKFTRGNTFTRELLRGKIMKNRSAFWQRKIIPQMRLILALG